MAEVRLEDIKPNSYKSKEIKPQNKKEAPSTTKAIVSKSAVVSTKKSIGQKFKEAFIAEDMADIKSWLIQDILIPGVKNTILDTLSMIFFKNGGGNRRSSSYNFYRYGQNSSASYASYYNGQRHSAQQNARNQSYTSHNTKVDYRDITLVRRDDAQKVVDEMRYRINEFGSVSIAAMLDLMEITSDFNDNNWGWTNPNSIGIRPVPNGWLIDVSEAEPLDN